MAPRYVQRTVEIFRVLRDREIRAMWLAVWVSDVGNFVTFIALAVYVNNLTGSAVAVGFALALRSVPWFTLGPFAGVLVDRLDRRRVMIWTNLFRAGLIAALPFTHAAWQAYVLSVSSAVFAPIFSPARQALLAQVAPGPRLVPALAVTETTHEALHTIGPAIGGLVVLLVGARSAFFVDAASFVLAAAILSTIRPRGKPAASASSAMKDLMDGFRAVARAPAVRAYLLLSSAQALGYGGVIALLVVYVRDSLGRPGGEYGIVLSVAGAGGVLASLVVAARDEHHPRTPWALISVIGMGVYSFVWFGPSLLMLMPIAFGAGLADTGFGIPMTATLAEALPDELRGRAYGVEQAMFELFAAIGSVGFAWLGETGRLGPAHGIAAASLTAASLGALVLVLGGLSSIRAHERERMAALKSSG